MRAAWNLLLAVSVSGCSCGDDDGGANPVDATAAADSDPGDDQPDASTAIVCEPDDADILERLERIPGLTVSEEPIDPPFRFFRMELEQPVDHDDPEGDTFQQRVTLLHRDLGAPMVLHTTGYYGVGYPFAAELTNLLGANQLNTEQRFFEPSRPDPADWSKLTIEQAAADHHRIVLALRPIYCDKWVGTGASKGGMTSVYHRRFYPNDVDVTVPYVAPISFGAPDDRYWPFFDTVATAGCRNALADYQRELLSRRATMIARMETEAEESGLTFVRSAGVEGAFEDAVIEFTWGFWQYGNPTWCASIPETDATDAALFNFLVDTGGLYFFDDATIEVYSPYYHQAESQLGFPSSPEAHLADLLETQAAPRDYLPDGATATYDPIAMQEVDAWVKEDGVRLLFVYGEFDPWYAGQFELGDAEDSLLLVAPGANHGASIADLDPDDFDAAIAALERWTGVAIDPARLRTSSARLPPAPTPPRIRF
jgi:hypothetical protein